MDTASDPEIRFDTEGICNHCYAARAKENQHRIDREQLPWVIDQIKKSGRGRAYDCVLGLSGGVDSSFALYELVQHGVRVFTFHCDNGWNTKESDENIMRLVEGLKVPFFRWKIDREKFHELQRAFIQSGVPNIEIPTDHILTSVAWKIARQEGVKTIISGGNWQTESIMPAVFGYSAVDLYHIQQIYKRFARLEGYDEEMNEYFDASGYPAKCDKYGCHTKILISRCDYCSSKARYRRKKVLSLTGLPTTNLAQYMWYRCVAKIKIVNILDYVNYNRNEAKKKLSDLYGWKNYGEKHEESIFTKWFQESYLPLVYGLDKRRPHLSSMIHCGQMTREEAVEIVNKPAKSTVGLQEVSRVLGSSFAYTTVEKRPHWYYPNHERLRKWAHKVYRHF